MLAAPQPPVLASDVMLEDEAPAAPGRSAERIAAVVVGVLGLVIELAAATAGHAPSWLMCAVFGIVLVLGVVPVPYSARAGALLAVAGGTSAMLLLQDGGADATAVGRAILFACFAIILPAGLFVRQNYCGARTGRVLTAVGVVAALVWLLLPGEGAVWRGFSDDTPHLIEACLRLALVPLALMALLAFMPSESTGACRLWAVLLLVWAATFLAASLWARTSSGSPTAALIWTARSRVAAALLIPTAAVALSHLLGKGIGERTRRRVARRKERREALVAETQRSVREMRVAKSSHDRAAQ